MLKGISNPDMKNPENKKMSIEPMMATCWLLVKMDRNRAMLIVAKRKRTDRAR
jgi:hypothetical protein